MVEQTMTGAARVRTSWLGALLIIFLALCIVNNVMLPVFEAPDEGDHFHYADFLARERRLPDLVKDLAQSHEIVQPPLYYALVGLIITPFDRANLQDLSHLNPDWFDPSVNADHRSVTNQYLHTPAEDFPYRGAALALHVARFVSSVLGALVVWLVYLIAQSLVRAARGVGESSPAFDALPLLAAALVALNPKFIHVSSIVSNDIAIIFASTLVCWVLVRMENGESRFEIRDSRLEISKVNNKSPISNFQSPFSFLLLGALIGVAVLCKVSGLGLLVPAGVSVVLLMLQRRIQMGQAIVAALAVGVGLAVVAGPWLVYNQTHYGNPLAWVQVQAANQTLLRAKPLDLAQIIQAVPEILISYWGVIGVELRFPQWVNVIFYIGLAVAVVGCAMIVARWATSIRHSGWKALSGAGAPVLVLLTWELTLLGSYALWLRDYIGTENSRLIFPGIALVAIAVAAGWLALVPGRMWRPVLVASCAALAALSTLTPFLIIRPAFATPTYLTAQERAALPGQMGITLGGKIHLQHAQINQRSANPGERVSISLFWGATQALRQSYHVILAARDVQGQLIGRLEAIPFGGRFDTQRWAPGQVFRDDYLLPIDATAQRGLASVQLSVRGVYENPPLLPIDSANTDQFEIGSVKVLGALQQVPAPQHPFVATFGAGSKALIQLLGYDLAANDKARTVALHWLCIRQPDRDYTLFIHVLDGNGTIIAQQDAPALNGAYPTSMWDEKEQIIDHRTIALPASATGLRIGWYSPGDPHRLTATRPDGSEWQDNAVVIPIDGAGER